MKERLIMKKNIVMMCAVIVTALGIAGCGQSTPRGTDRSVKNTVIEIVKDRMKNKFMFRAYYEIAGKSVMMTETLNALKSRTATDPESLKVIKAVDEKMSKVKVSLENIRLLKVDDSIKKSYSSADLIVNGTTVPIEYTAQRNEDGKVYVEVIGVD
jgi:predicted small lipoprotein YifL